MNQAAQDAVRTSTSLMLGGAYGGVISNIAKPENQSRIRALIKGVMTSF